MFPFLSPLHLLKLPRPQTAAPSGVAGSVLPGRMYLIWGWYQLFSWGFKHWIFSNCRKAQQGRSFKWTKSPQMSEEGNNRAIWIWAGLKRKSFLFGVARDFFFFFSNTWCRWICIATWLASGVCCWIRRLYSQFLTCLPLAYHFRQKSRNLKPCESVERNIGSHSTCWAALPSRPRLDYLAPRMQKRAVYFPCSQVRVSLQIICKLGALTL